MSMKECRGVFRAASGPGLFPRRVLFLTLLLASCHSQAGSPSPFPEAKVPRLPGIHQHFKNGKAKVLSGSETGPR